MYEKVEKLKIQDGGRQVRTVYIDTIVSQLIVELYKSDMVYGTGFEWDSTNWNTACTL